MTYELIFFFPFTVSTFLSHIIFKRPSIAKKNLYFKQRAFKIYNFCSTHIFYDSNSWFHGKCLTDFIIKSRDTEEMS